jgi:hypothetical protein
MDNNKSRDSAFINTFNKNRVISMSLLEPIGSKASCKSIYHSLDACFKPYIDFISNPILSCNQEKSHYL